MPISLTFSQNVNKQKLFKLIIGIVGIYITFCIGGVLHQYILKQPYHDRIDNSQTIFSNPSGIIAFEKLVVFLFGLIYNKIFLQHSTITPIPKTNSIICAAIVFISSITNNTAIILVSFPIVIMFKSCNILVVILIGVFCSRVKNKNLKLTGNKIVGAVAVSVGIVMFKVFDPEAKVGEERKVQLIGLVCLLVSLLADGFLPDFQAQIKQKFKPQPTVMMVEINKWCCIIAISYCVITGEIVGFVTFAWRHPLFSFHLMLMSTLSFIGHIFIYNMIKDFKQHIVPFVITTRKIISVGISMLYFRHASSLLQVLGILIVFGSTLFEFLTEVIKGDKRDETELVEQIQNEPPKMSEEIIASVVKTQSSQNQQKKESKEQMVGKEKK